MNSSHSALFLTMLMLMTQGCTAPWQSVWPAVCLLLAKTAGFCHQRHFSTLFVLSFAVGQVMAEEDSESAEGWRDYAEETDEEVPSPAALCQEALHHLHIHFPGGHPVHHLHRSFLESPGIAR